MDVDNIYKMNNRSSIFTLDTFEDIPFLTIVETTKDKLIYIYPEENGDFKNRNNIFEFICVY